MKVLSGGEQPATHKTGSTLAAAGIALFSLALFVFAFILFMLAPLLMMFLVGGSMFAAERWGKRKRAGVVSRPGGTPAGPRPSGSGPAELTAKSFGFGGIAGEDL